MAFSILVRRDCGEFNHTHPSIVAFETLGLPDRHVDGVDTITDTGDGSREDHLNILRGGRLEYGTHNHDPASPHDTAFAAEAICREEGDYGAEKTSDVIDACNDTLKISTWVVELLAERGKADDGSEDSLVISEELGRHRQTGTQDADIIFERKNGRHCIPFMITPCRKEKETTA